MGSNFLSIKKHVSLDDGHGVNQPTQPHNSTLLKPLFWDIIVVDYNNISTDPRKNSINHNLKDFVLSYTTLTEVHGQWVKTKQKKSNYLKVLHQNI